MNNLRHTACLASTMVLVACDHGSKDTGAAVDKSPTTYDGWETLEFDDGTIYGNGTNCSLLWTLKGSPSSRICEGCDWVFDITATYAGDGVSYDDGDGLTHDDGTCANAGLTTDMSFTYGLVEGYIDQYQYLLYYNAEYGEFFPWVQAYYTTDGKLEYAAGYRNSPYNGLYYSYFQRGRAWIK